MKLEIEVKRKSFTNREGKAQEYFSLTANFGGEEVKIKLDKDKNELFKYFLGKMDIPLEKDDEKEALYKRLLAGEQLSDADKAKLRTLLTEEEDD